MRVAQRSPRPARPAALAGACCLKFAVALVLADVMQMHAYRHDAAGRIEAACATGFGEIIDARGKARCVPSDQVRSNELRQHQRRELKVLQDNQNKLKADQRELDRELGRELGREQTTRTNAQRSEQKKRQIDLGK